jgi:hypothetical protein
MAPMKYSFAAQAKSTNVTFFSAPAISLPKINPPTKLATNRIIKISSIF